MTLQRTHLLSYGLLGLPLAFVALPLYVHLPHWYASQFGMSLALLGAVLLAARVFDALTDPWLGLLADRLFARSSALARRAASASAVVLCLGMVALFFPPWPQPQTPLLQALALGGVLVLTCLAFSFMSITHQAWAARWGATLAAQALPALQTRIVAWREAAGLLGVVLASVLPALGSWALCLAVFALALAAGCWAWSRSPEPSATPWSLRGRNASDGASGLAWQRPWAGAQFRRLLLVFVLSGMASAVPATLVLFFVQDRLQAQGLEALFLGLYFVAAALSMPLWTRSVARFGLAGSWLLGMVLAVLVFGWTALLGAGDTLAFALVCALSGLALGSDLSLPPALLAHTIAQRGDQGREGAYFGWWNLAAKLNLALAAGLTLPLLQWLGYQPGQASAQGLQALTLVYALLPCAAKLLAAAALYLFWLRPGVRAAAELTSGAKAPHPGV